MEELRNKYHDFSNDFVWRILGLEGVDTSLWSSAIKQFHRDYYPIYTATQSLNKEVETSIADTKEAIIKVTANGKRALKVFFGGLMGTPNSQC